MSANKSKPIDFKSAGRTPEGDASKDAHARKSASEDAAGQSAQGQDVVDSDVTLDGDLDEYGKLLAEKQELMNTLVRRQADFENYRKRVEKERHQERHRGIEQLIEQLIPVLDTFDRALAGPDEGAGAEYRKGFELIRRQLSDTLAKQGLVRTESMGKQFDPHFHHAIGQVETSEHAEGVIVEELQPGYLFHERVLRPAMVRVASPPAGRAGRATRHDN